MINFIFIKCSMFICRINHSSDAWFFFNHKGYKSDICKQREVVYFALNNTKVLICLNSFPANVSSNVASCRVNSCCRPTVFSIFNPFSPANHCVFLKLGIPRSHCFCLKCWSGRETKQFSMKCFFKDPDTYKSFIMIKWSDPIRSEFLTPALIKVTWYHKLVNVDI